MSKRTLWTIIIVLSLLLLRSWWGTDEPTEPEAASEATVESKPTASKPIQSRVPAPATRAAPVPWQPPAQPSYSTGGYYSSGDYYSRPPAPMQANPYAFPPTESRNPRPKPSYQSPSTPPYETAQTDRYSASPVQPLPQQPWDSYYTPPSQQPPPAPEYSQPRGRWTGNYPQQTPQWQFRK